MFCTHCGVQLSEPEPNFCASCGKPTSRARREGFYQKRLQRPLQGRKIAGVCAGFAEYFEVDVTLIRVLAVIGLFFSLGTGLLAYWIAVLVMPSEELPAPARETPTQPWRA
jgi:phage shock protein C